MSTRGIGMGLGGLLLAVCVVAPRSARACGAAPEPWYTVDRQSPQGEGVFLDAPIVIELKETRTTVEASPPSFELVLRSAQETLTLGPRSAVGNRLIFVPPQPLSPDTTYRASISIGQTLADGSEGPAQPTQATWDLTTGTDSSPPLTLDGELQVSLEPGMDPTYSCTNPCGSDCTETGAVSVTKARITLPHASGGVPGRLFGTVVLTSDVPYDFAPPEKGAPESEPAAVTVQQPVELVEGEAPPLLLTLPGAENAYKPCFALQVSDDRGNKVSATPLCLKELFPSLTPTAGSGASVPDGLANDVVEPRESSSCSSTRPGRSTLWPLPLAALLLGRLRRLKRASARRR